MQIRNNYDIIWTRPDKIDYSKLDEPLGVPEIVIGAAPLTSTGVYNGDIGFITDIDAENELLYVLYDDRLAAYSFDLLSEIEHAYAMTVHKAQGSEYRAVVLLALEGMPQLMSRRVLYTAATRARELLIIVGNDTTVYNMIDNHKATRRFSGLRARLVEAEE